MQSFWWDFWDWPLPSTAQPPFTASSSDAAAFNATGGDRAAGTVVSGDASNFGATGSDA